MDSIRINTGVKTIALENEAGEQTGTISFNPNDILFAERFYDIFGKLQSKQQEFEAKADAIDKKRAELAETGDSDNGLDEIALIKDFCIFMRGEIDHLFGEGTSQAAFGDTMSLDAIFSLFNGLAPFINKARQEKVKQYSYTRSGQKVMK